MGGWERRLLLRGAVLRAWRAKGSSALLQFAKLARRVGGVHPKPEPLEVPQKALGLTSPATRAVTPAQLTLSLEQFCPSLAGGCKRLTVAPGSRPSSDGNLPLLSASRRYRSPPALFLLGEEGGWCAEQLVVPKPTLH